MKVVCGACQAKYQIPDERVAGRKLKIRCRKCGEAIVVRGDQIAPEEAATQHIQTNGHHVNGVAGEWHVSIDGDQHGPYATNQMAAMLRNGQVGWEAYAWREGYAEWKVAAESDTLVRAVASMPIAATPEAEFAPPPEAFEEDGPTRIAGSVPAGALAPVARTTFSARAAQRVNHAAIETPASVVVAAEQPVDYGYASAQAAAPSPFGYSGSPYVSAEQALTGERHEDSVLFSTKNLQSATSASQSSPSRGGFASGEGSGLIDIRALAALARTSQTQQTSNGVTNGASAAESGQFGRRGRDEVMTLANQTGAFSNLDSLRPFEAPARPSSNAVPIAIVVGSAIVAAAVVVAVLITRDSPAVPVTAVSQPIAPEPAAAPAAPEPEPAAAEPAAAEPAAAADDAVKEPEPEATPDDREPAVAKSSKSEKRSSGGSSSKRASEKGSKSPAKPVKAQSAIAAKAAASADTKDTKQESASLDDILLADPKPERGAKAEKPEPEAEAAPAPEPVKPAAPSRSRSIDELLEGAVVEGDKKGEKSAPSAASAALADSPTRDQVKAAMQAIEPAVKACADGQTADSQTATVAITVAGSSGKVSSVRVTGIGGAIGSCVARAVRGATFPKFAKESFSLNFPFRLK